MKIVFVTGLVALVGLSACVPSDATTSMCEQPPPSSQTRYATLVPSGDQTGSVARAAVTLISSDPSSFEL